MIKKVKCHICNYKFHIEKSKVVKVIENKGLSSIATGASVYNAIDCPNCGCQKILWTRLPEISNVDKK